MKNQTVLAMALLRLCSGIIEICAALLILRLNRVEAALRINGLLALIGPVLLISGILLGAAGLSGHVPPGRLALIYAGAILLFLGTSKL